MPPARTSRRDFLRLAGLGSAVLGAGSVQALGAETRAAAANGGQGRAKNVVFMVSDGMSISTVGLADAWMRFSGGKSSRWLSMYRELPVVRGLCETASANSMVTDSAAAASCWGIGERTTNGVINVTPDGRRPETIVQKMKASGRRTGLVTTATVTHATPAGFAATIEKRSDQKGIAPQYLARGVDVVLGGGTDFFPDELVADYRKAGYAHLASRKDLLAWKGDSPALGLFSKSHVPFEVDRLNDPAVAAQTPTLAEMTEAALRRLSAGPDGFFLMVEGARIDHACHGNDPVGAILDQVAFDAAIATVLKFVESSPDTLVIITADHGTGGMQLNGMGSEDFAGKAPAYQGTTEAFRRLMKFNRSQEVLGRLTKGLDPKKFLAAAQAATGLEFPSADAAKVVSLKGLNEVLPKYVGVSWTSKNHTADPVEFAAYGPGASLFQPFQRNDEVHARVLRAAGIG
ncbi:MAG: alkaline phosphatase [Opitutia bacterium]